MRSEFSIVGVGQRRSGTSQTGRAYDFTPVSFVFEDKQFQGVRAATVNVDAQSLNGYLPVIGEMVDVVYHYADNRLFVDAILGKVED